MCVTVRWLFTDHVAMGVRANLRLLTVESADRVRAHCLAQVAEVIIANEVALGLLTPCRTLRASQGLVPLAQILLFARAVHTALWGAALNIALLELRGIHLRASRFTLAGPANRLAILLADRLRAVPRAVRQAAHALLIWNNLPVRAEGLARDVRFVSITLVANHLGCFGDVGTDWRLGHLFGGCGIQVVLILVRDRDRNPDVAQIGFRATNISDLPESAGRAHHQNSSFEKRHAGSGQPRHPTQMLDCPPQASTAVDTL
mmetsp:Transcript_23524/g.51809  ORF Transcript_23524/g.51809 Transcript_23524/m.51809 type:complete len:260 (+) Transcript_23524:972-1751(+)